MSEVYRRIKELIYKINNLKFAPYLIAALAVLLTTAVRFAFNPVLENRAAFLFSYLAIIIVSYFFGRKAGYLVTVLSLLAGWYLFIPPVYSFVIEDPTTALVLALFTIVGISISIFGGKLHEFDALRSAIFNSSLDAIITADADGKIIEWNKSAEDIFNYSRNDVLGKDMAEILIPPALRNTDRMGMKHFLKTGENAVLGKKIDLLAMRSDGSTFPSELIINKIQSEPLRYTGFIRDVTQLKIQQNALKESEERFRNMADSAPVLIWITDVDGKGSYFNNQWLEFRARTLDEELGEGWLTGFHSEDLPLLLPYLNAKDKLPFKIQVRMLRSDNNYRYMINTGIPRFSNDGVFQGYICTCSDISEIKQFEEERGRLLLHERHLRNEAEMASKMKDEFLATLSHELRTPLNAIMGWSQLLRRRRFDPIQVEQGVDVIERNARSQTRIIEDLLDMNRIISGKARLDIQSVELPKILEEAIETVRPAAEAKEIVFKKIFDPMITNIRGDAQRLQQVFWNLLANAVKFSSKKGEIQVRIARVESHVEIAIKDSGEGIPAEFLPFVFDRFRQADASTTRKHGGLGLGLSIAKSLTELHGGSIYANSSGGGQGAVFKVVLPISAVFSEGLVQEILTDQPSKEVILGEAINLSGINVLVVDDEPDARQMIKEVLIDCGASITTASSAIDAMESIRNKIPDVIISDIGMPLIDGYEFLKQLRALPLEQGGKIPAIALTAFARPEDRLAALKAGYQMHISKPVEAAELMQVVRSVSDR